MRPIIILNDIDNTWRSGFRPNRKKRASDAEQSADSGDVESSPGSSPDSPEGTTPGSGSSESTVGDGSTDDSLGNNSIPGGSDEPGERDGSGEPESPVGSGGPDEPESPVGSGGPTSPMAFTVVVSDDSEDDEGAAAGDGESGGGNGPISYTFDIIDDSDDSHDTSANTTAFGTYTGNYRGRKRRKRPHTKKASDKKRKRAEDRRKRARKTAWRRRHRMPNVIIVQGEQEQSGLRDMFRGFFRFFTSMVQTLVFYTFANIACPCLVMTGIYGGWVNYAYTFPVLNAFRQTARYFHLFDRKVTRIVALPVGQYIVRVAIQVAPDITDYRVLYYMALLSLSESKELKWLPHWAVQEIMLRAAHVHLISTGCSPDELNALDRESLAAIGRESWTTAEDFNAWMRSPVEFISFNRYIIRHGMSMADMANQITVHGLHDHTAPKIAMLNAITDNTEYMAEVPLLIGKAIKCLTDKGNANIALLAHCAVVGVMVNIDVVYTIFAPLNRSASMHFVKGLASILAGTSLNVLRHSGLLILTILKVPVSLVQLAISTAQIAQGKTPACLNQSSETSQALSEHEAEARKGLSETAGENAADSGSSPSSNDDSTTCNCESCRQSREMPGDTSRSSTSAPSTSKTGSEGQKKASSEDSSKPAQGGETSRPGAAESDSEAAAAEAQNEDPDADKGGLSDSHDKGASPSSAPSSSTPSGEGASSSSTSTDDSSTCNCGNCRRSRRAPEGTSGSASSVPFPSKTAPESQEEASAEDSSIPVQGKETSRPGDVESNSEAAAAEAQNEDPDTDKGGLSDTPDKGISSGSASGKSSGKSGKAKKSGSKSGSKSGKSGETKKSGCKSGKSGSKSSKSGETKKSGDASNTSSKSGKAKKSGKSGEAKKSGDASNTSSKSGEAKKSGKSSKSGISDDVLIREAFDMLRRIFEELTGEKLGPIASSAEDAKNKKPLKTRSLNRYNTDSRAFSLRALLEYFLTRYPGFFPTDFVPATKWGEKDTLYLNSCATAIVCPCCGEKCRVTGYEETRTIQDTSIRCGVGMLLKLNLRRAVCTNRNCAMFNKGFVEQCPFVLPSTQHTTRVQFTALTIATSTSFANVSLLMHHMGTDYSDDLVRKLVLNLDFGDDTDVRIIGIDDVASRKGWHYYSILYDMETGRVLKLLLGRGQRAFEEWLEAHPKVEVVCRDRASAYAAAVQEYCNKHPDRHIVQVADRFHILKNLSDYLYDLYSTQIPYHLTIDTRGENPVITASTVEKIYCPRVAKPEGIEKWKYDNTRPKDENGNEIELDIVVFTESTKERSRRIQKQEALYRRARQVREIYNQWREESPASRLARVSKEVGLSEYKCKKYLDMTDEELADKLRKKPEEYKKACKLHALCAGMDMKAKKQKVKEVCEANSILPAEWDKYSKMTDEELEALRVVPEHKAREKLFDNYKYMAYKILRDHDDIAGAFWYIHDVAGGWTLADDTLMKYIIVTYTEVYPDRPVPNIDAYIEKRYPDGLIVVGRKKLFCALQTFDEKKKDPNLDPYLDMICKQYSVCGKIRDAAKEFHDIIIVDPDMKQRTDEKRHAAMARLDQFIEDHKAETDDLFGFVKSVSGDKENIVNGILTDYSSGKVEGSNNKFKLIKRQSYSY